MKVPVLIEGVRVRLRQATAADAAALFALVDDAELMHFMDWPRARSVGDTRNHLQTAEQHWAAGTEHQYLIQRKPGGQTIGSISFRPRGHAVDFGYLLGRAFWGQGLATEAAQLLLQWLQRQPAVLRIWATCDADNTRSAAVLIKAGLDLEGRLRCATVRPNIGRAPRDTLLYAWCRDPVPHEPARPAEEPA